MPTSYKDQFFTIDPFNPPGFGTPMNFARSEVIDNDDGGQIVPNSGDTFNGVIITSVFIGDTVTIFVPGTGNITYIGVTYYLASGPAVFSPNDGQALQNGTLVSATGVPSGSPQHSIGSFGPTCFTPGTLIETATGPRLIESLQPGDLILTGDDGLQPLIKLARETVRAIGNCAPVLFAKGAIGNTGALFVSQQHRLLISGWKAELHTGQSSILVAAKHMVNGATITFQPGGTVDYIHLLFDRHQIVFAEGVPSESYFPAHALDAEDDETRVELLRVFPNLQLGANQGWRTVRPVAKSIEARLFA